MSTGNKPEEIWRKEIGERIIQARKELGMRQEELADLTHVSVRSMQAYESGEVLPWRYITDIASVLNKPRDWILHGRDGDTMTDTGVILEAIQKLQVTLDKQTELLERIAS